MNVPTQAILPPCLQVVAFDGRAAILQDGRACSQHSQHRFLVEAGEPAEWSTGSLMHPDYQMPKGGPRILRREFTDSDKANATYAQASEWVLTGELP